jgi:hypothetical protein
MAQYAVLVGQGEGAADRYADRPGIVRSRPKAIGEASEDQGQAEPEDDEATAGGVSHGRDARSARPLAGGGKDLDALVAHAITSRDPARRGGLRSNGSTRLRNGMAAP